MKKNNNKRTHFLVISRGGKKSSLNFRHLHWHLFSVILNYTPLRSVNEMKWHEGNQIQKLNSPEYLISDPDLLFITHCVARDGWLVCLIFNLPFGEDTPHDVKKKMSGQQ